MGPLGSQGNLIQVIAIIGTLVIAARAMRYIGPAIAKRLGGEVGGTQSETLRSEIEELKMRIAELEQERGRVAELEERLDFTERMLAKPPEARRLEQ